jgi:hypothetical protein
MRALRSINDISLRLPVIAGRPARRKPLLYLKKFPAAEMNLKNL